MLPATVIFLFLAIFFITAYRSQRTETEKNAAVMRHTITVNLDILDGELVQLKTIALSAPSSEDQAKASLLLVAAQKTSDAIRPALQTASNEKLETMLGQVFQAMNQSTDARRLLKACTIK